MLAETIATALGGRKADSSWTALCPAHDDCGPSLCLQDAGDGKVLVHCHAGCTQSEVIAALRAHGLWNKRLRPQSHFKRQRPRRPDNDRLESDDSKRTDMALEIWERAAPGGGTLVEDYLRSRGIHESLPPALRFRAGLRHPSGGTWPAMVALVTRRSDDWPSWASTWGRYGRRRRPSRVRLPHRLMSRSPAGVVLQRKSLAWPSRP